MSAPPRAVVRRGAQEASRHRHEDELAARLEAAEQEEDHQNDPGADEEDYAEEDAAEQEQEQEHEPGLIPHVAEHAPGGPPMELEAAEGAGAGGAAGAAAAARDPLAEDDDLVCVICMQSCSPADAIHSCSTCALVVHLECMRSWMVESAERKNKLARCPGCNQVLELTSFELAYYCWCGKVCWDRVEGREPAHSCGGICGADRGAHHRGGGNDGAFQCPHPCEHVCHRGMCAPCGHTRSGVRCAGDHVTYDAFPCGGEPARKCILPCGQKMDCGHPCAAPCHGPDQPHAACVVPVAKTCACGKARAPAVASSSSSSSSSAAAPDSDGPSAGDEKGGVRVPCSQVVVQCGAPCGQMQACGQHRCERICHAGACQEQLVASAWGKGSWVRVGPSAAAAAASAAPPSSAAAAVPAARPGIGADFPSLGGGSGPRGAASSSSSAAAPAAAAASAGVGAGFRSCGKPCGRRRACGHACAATCHNIDGSSSSLCDALPCAQLVTLSCPCARKTERVRCSDLRNLAQTGDVPAAASAASKASSSSAAASVAAAAVAAAASVQRCDHVCAAVAQGKLFEREVATAIREDPLAIGELRTLLPYPASLLTLLCGGGSGAGVTGAGGSGSGAASVSASHSSAASAGSSSAHAMGSEALFVRKTEAQMRKFVIDLATAMDRDEQQQQQQQHGAAGAVATGAAIPMRPNAVKSSAGASAAPVSRHLFLTGLTNSRRQMVAQLALAMQLHFDVDDGSLRARSPPPPSTAAAAAAAAAAGSKGSISSSSQDECKEDQEAKEEAKQQPTAATAAADPVAAGMPRTSFLLPSLSLTAAADLFKPSAHLPSLCTADNWPGALRVRLQFDGDQFGSSAGDSAAASTAARQLQRWLEPFFGLSRTVWTSGRHVSVLFGSALRARQCYGHLMRTHSAELASAHVLAEAPEFYRAGGTGGGGAHGATASAGGVLCTSSADVAALVAQEHADSAEQKRLEGLARAAAEAEYAALQARQARHRAAHPPASSSVLPTPPPSAKEAVRAVRSKELVGHTIVQLKQSNVWAALQDSEE